MKIFQTSWVKQWPLERGTTISRASVKKELTIAQTQPHVLSHVALINQEGHKSNPEVAELTAVRTLTLSSGLNRIKLFPDNHARLSPRNLHWSYFQLESQQRAVLSDRFLADSSQQPCIEPYS